MQGLNVDKVVVKIHEVNNGDPGNNSGSTPQGPNITNLFLGLSLSDELKAQIQPDGLNECDILHRFLYLIRGTIGVESCKLLARP